MPPNAPPPCGLTEGGVVGIALDGGLIPPVGAAAPPDKKAELRKQAMADAGVQAMLEVFPAEIRDVEEM